MILLVKFEVLLAVNVRGTVFRNVAQYSLVETVTYLEKLAASSFGQFIARQRGVISRKTALCMTSAVGLYGCEN